jgi:hypothetical protein
LGQLFKITPNLKQYVATKLALGRKNVIASKPNLVIGLVVIDPHIAMIQV